jgi:hypothetical protein
MADEILAADLRSELCRECEGRGVNLGDPEELVVLDANNEDTGVRAILARYVCERGHVWYAGEGKARGRGGEAPILLEDHYAQRRTKEVYMEEGVVGDWIDTEYNRKSDRFKQSASDGG